MYRRLGEALQRDILKDLIAGVCDGQYIVQRGVVRVTSPVGLLDFVPPDGMLCRCAQSRAISGFG